MWMKCHLRKLLKSLFRAILLSEMRNRTKIKTILNHLHNYAVRTRSTAYTNLLDIKMENLEILDVGDYNISETITTTETWVAPFGSVTLSVVQNENETRISFTVSEIFDRKREPWTRYFFILILLIFIIMPCELAGIYEFARANLTSKSKILMMATAISQKR